ncbi:MAG: hypothetical protein DRJ05_01125 [Bacteroidetes bacterium]|nr:MAG: hypothetical protein DRI89_03780 [Bacteroidota bacterium]RLD62111.1 MAG: hypothetical protein DRJ05_01125 [Bacteroidota bacterium]
MNRIILTTPSELRNEIKSVFLELEKEKSKYESAKLYTINQVAKQLGKAHATIKKFVEAGLIETTKSGLITEDAINDYLNR